MAKKNKNRRNKRGGWIGSEWFDSLKKKVSSAYSSVTGSPDSSYSSSSYTPSSYTPSSSTSYDEPISSTSYDEPNTSASYDEPNTSTSYGGKRRKTRKMRGGYSDNISTSNLAANASPFSGSTVRAHSYVGGRKTKRRYNKHKKTHRRHCRK
jgi:hypothetical protein